MRTIFTVFLLIQLIPDFYASATGKPSAREVPISFAALAQVTPGTFSKVRLTQMLGKPTEVFHFKDLPDSKDGGESWKYKAHGNERLTVFFEEGSEVVNSWVLHIYEGEPEQSLKTAMNHYLAASWIPETERWINPHSFPNNCYFKDGKKGVSIEYNLARKEVFSIVRWDPSRNIASSEKAETPPQFCIDKSCSPGIPSEEFFREIPVTKYCEVPK